MVNMSRKSVSTDPRDRNSREIMKIGRIIKLKEYKAFKIKEKKM